jgi:predicted TIM-barrel fold metal-dependent hydrolase
MATGIEDTGVKELGRVWFPEASRSVTFLPEPERRLRPFTLISVDDHLVEPAETWVGRVPARMVDDAPRIVDLESGGQAWLYDGNLIPNLGLNAVAGRPVNEYSGEPTRFEHMRRGAWNIDARISDMDLAGVFASICFPSHITGFGGGRLQTATKNLELALAAVRGWNDWHIEDWAGPYPDRIIPLQIPWLHDPALGAEEIRRNHARGFKAVTFPESPHNLGFPSIHESYYDPILAACEETETVVCLHVGSGGVGSPLSPGAPNAVESVLFGSAAMNTAIDWLFSGIALRFPGIKICLSEGGIGWVPGVFDRLDHLMKYPIGWPSTEVTPAEVLSRNFWFCSVDDPSTFSLRDRIGIEHILLEVDYPHADSTWPDTQDMLARYLVGIPDHDIARMTWENASILFRHPVPTAVQNNPDAF